MTSSPDKIEEWIEKPFPPTRKRIPFRKRKTHSKYTSDTNNPQHQTLAPSPPPPPPPPTITITSPTTIPTITTQIQSSINLNNNTAIAASVSVDLNRASTLPTDMTTTAAVTNLDHSILSITEDLPKPLIFNKEEDKLLVDNNSISGIYFSKYLLYTL